MEERPGRVPSLAIVRSDAAMNVLVIDHEEVPDLLPMAACMDAVANALRAHARGEDVQPLRKTSPPYSRSTSKHVLSADMPVHPEKKLFPVTTSSLRRSALCAISRNVGTNGGDSLPLYLCV